MNLSTKNSLKLMYLEAALSTMVFAMPIFTIFYQDELGLTLAQLGLSQAIFMIAVLTLNVPTGWLADRFSLKWSNVFGNAVAAFGFLLYAFSQNFSDVVIAEIIIGIGVAFSGGADAGLIKNYCHELNKNFKKVSANIATLRPIGEIVAVSVGGLVGATNPRLAIGLSTASYGLASVLCLFLKPVNTRRKSAHNPFKDMAIIVTYALHGHRELKWRILGFAISREITHPIVWVVTPLMLIAGVPPAILGIGWALTLIATILGSAVARRYTHKISDVQKFYIPMFASIAAALIIGVNINLISICLLVVFGFTRGWVNATALATVQHHAPNDIQATIVSVATSVSQLLYIPLVIGVGALADYNLQLTMLSWILFLPVILLIGNKLRHEPEKAT